MLNEVVEGIGLAGVLLFLAGDEVFLASARRQRAHTAARAK